MMIKVATVRAEHKVGFLAVSVN
jgi:hypothetical protein